MRKKKPISHETHINDWLALEYLKSVIPRHWKLIKPVDVFSGIEYGQDWLVQITDDQNSLSGAEFRVQCKTIRRKTTKRAISANLRVSTLNYLSEVPLPVLLHFFHYPSNIGYWMWLQPWHLENYNPDWEKKKEVAVNIPLSNILDESAIDQISAYVLNFQTEHVLLEKSKIVSQADSDFSVIFSTGNPLLTIQPKHNQPRPFYIEFNDDSKDIFTQWHETGQEAKLRGEVKFGGPLGKFIEETFGSSSEITLKRLSPDKDGIFRITFISDYEKTVYQIELIRMRFVQVGSRVVVLEGKFILHHQDVILRVTFDDRTKVVSLNFHFEETNADVLKLDQQLSFLELLNTAYGAIITNLEDVEKPIRIGIPGTTIFESPQIDLFERRLIKALATITTYSSVSFYLPDTFSNVTLALAEAIAQGFVTGRAPILPNIPENTSLKINAVILNPDQFLAGLERDERAEAALPGPESVELLGAKVPLGATRFVFSNLTLRNVDYVRRMLLQNTSEVSLHLEFQIDRASSYTEFLEWPRSAEQNLG